MFNHYICVICTLVLSLSAAKCGADKGADVPTDSGPIEITSPQPSALVQGVTLSDVQRDFVKRGNVFSFRCLKAIFEQSEGDNLVYSPLSLQYALAMAANGASVSVAEEIAGILGYDGSIHEMNVFMKTLLDQLPALDAEVELKVTDAILINDKFKADTTFQRMMNSVYYAPVEYFSSSFPENVLGRINEWASRNTNGRINPFLYKSDINGDLSAILLNALYFKAPWSDAVFIPELAFRDALFYLENGSTINVDYMYGSTALHYCQRAGYEVLALPYAGEDFTMYVLLPERKSGNGLNALMSVLSGEEWTDMIGNMNVRQNVVVFLPSFEITKRYQLRQTLDALGLEKGFGSISGFDRMIVRNGRKQVCEISEIIQKSHIQVTEWGTEAASVTAEMMVGDSGIEHKPIIFKADHPFVFVIAEKTSGVILFEGVFIGKESI